MSQMSKMRMGVRRGVRKSIPVKNRACHQRRRNRKILLSKTHRAVHLSRTMTSHPAPKPPAAPPEAAPAHPDPVGRTQERNG